MKLQQAIKSTVNNLFEDDVVILIGRSVCNEASKFRANNTLFLYDAPGAGFSFATGLAMCSKKRIFVFCSDDVIMSELSSLLQMAISECKNLFVVLFISGEYQNVDKFPTFCKTLKQLYGLFFSFGFLVNNYSHFYKDIKRYEKELNNILSNIKGPLITFIEVDPGLSKDVVQEDNFDAVREFING